MKAYINSTIFFVLLFACSSSIFASVHNDVSTSLYEKLVDVNKEWSNHQSYKKKLTKNEVFQSDEALIQKHLFLVVEHLRKNQPENLMKNQLKARTEMLEILWSYANKGEFPINLYHKKRQPYFIDYKGTACAVGYLMLQTKDYSVTAIKISKENNYAYIQELADNKALQGFANEYGFTIDELAWIQPGYSVPPTYKWFPLVNSIDGEVLSLHSFNTNSEVYIGGNFSSVNGLMSKGVVKWDGQNISALSHGIDGEVRCMTHFNGNLVVGGNFNFTEGNKTFKNVALWNGSIWNEISASESIIINDLEVFNGELYAAGMFVDPNDTQDTFGLKKWNGSSWERSNINVKGVLNDFYSDSSSLFIAGDFNEINSDTGFNNIAQFDLQNGFQKIGNGINYSVNAVCKYDSVIYAGTDFVYDSIDYWNGGGFYTKHHSQDTFHKGYSINDIYWLSDSVIQGIFGLSVINEALVYHGIFQFYPMYGYHGQNVIISSNNSYQSGGMINEIDGAIHAAAQFKDKLIIGGNFSSLNNFNIKSIAYTLLDSNYTNIHNPKQEALNFQLFPNPANQTISLKFNNDKFEAKELKAEIYSVDGKNMGSELIYQMKHLQFNVNNLSNGLYYLVVKNENEELASKPFIISR